MSIEVESKFPVVSTAEAQRRLEQIGARAGREQQQIDTYYAHPARDFSQTGEAFRWRRVGLSNRLTYKGPQLLGAAKTRREVELPVARGEAGARSCAALLDALGFTPIAEVRKRRTPLQLAWGGRAVEVALDEVDQLGTFVEVEILCDQREIEATQKAVRGLAASLGLRAPEPRTYLELILEAQSERAIRP